MAFKSVGELAFTVLRKAKRTARRRAEIKAVHPEGGTSEPPTGNAPVLRSSGEGATRAKGMGVAGKGGDPHQPGSGARSVKQNRRTGSANLPMTITSRRRPRASATPMGQPPAPALGLRLVVDNGPGLHYSTARTSM